jgi:hypothetical protein
LGENATPATTTTCARSYGDLDFEGATLRHNNLANFGPDGGEPALRYEGVLTSSTGQVIDLVVTNTSESVRTVFVAWHTNTSEFNTPTGKMISFVVQGNTAIDLNFAFVKSGTHEPVTLDEAHITIVDMDHSKDAALKERVLVADLDSYVIDPNAEIAVSIDSSNRVIFESSAFGPPCVGTNDPMNLRTITCTDGASDQEVTVNQKRRSFLLTFEDVSNFNLTLDVPCTSAPQDCAGSARHFYFTGSSSLANACTH